MTKDKRKKILVVDDELDILRIIKRALELKNYEVICATTGEETLEKMDETVSVVLLDVMLPDASGYEICEKIKSNSKFKNIPVIMLSAKTQMSDITKGLDVGADTYITKPFDPFNIPAQLEDILQRKERNK